MQIRTRNGRRCHSRIWLRLSYIYREVLKDPSVHVVHLCTLIFALSNGFRGYGKWKTRVDRKAYAILQKMPKNDFKVGRNGIDTGVCFQTDITLRL